MGVVPLLLSSFLGILGLLQVLEGLVLGLLDLYQIDLKTRSIPELGFLVEEVFLSTVLLGLRLLVPEPHLLFGRRTHSQFG